MQVAPRLLYELTSTLQNCTCLLLLLYCINHHQPFVNLQFISISEDCKTTPCFVMYFSNIVQFFLLKREKHYKSRGIPCLVLLCIFSLYIVHLLLHQHFIYLSTHHMSCIILMTQNLVLKHNINGSSDKHIVRLKSQPIVKRMQRKSLKLQKSSCHLAPCHYQKSFVICVNLIQLQQPMCERWSLAICTFSTIVTTVIIFDIKKTSCH